MSMKKKLIEVALPLEAINKASAREKWIRQGVRDVTLMVVRGGQWQRHGQ